MLLLLEYLLCCLYFRGDLLLWNLKYTKGQPFQTFYCTEFRPHMRSVFNICASGPRGETLCTFAQDRHVGLQQCPQHLLHGGHKVGAVFQNQLMHNTFFTADIKLEGCS